MSCHKYTPEQNEFIKQNYDNVGECVQKFNARFGTDISYSGMKTHANRTLGITTGFRPFTIEMNTFLADTLREYPYKRATEIFNKHYGTSFTRKQIEYHCTRCGIKREYATFMAKIDGIILENKDKSYEEIRKIIKERTGQEYSDCTAVCVRANKLGINKPHRVWHTSDRRTINGEKVSFSEYARFIGNRWHRIDPSLQPIALQVVRLQSEASKVNDGNS